jgi:hypothetical protein
MRVALVLALLFAAQPASRYFVVRVLDAETGRGVPLIQLTLPNEVSYWTDSAGVAALDEPSFSGIETRVSVQGHGYEFPEKDVVVRIQPGHEQVIRVKRTMIAERMYRLTGEGIYRDSVVAGLMKPPLMNGRVLGQDTVSAALYKSKVYWIWGDTIHPASWNFNVAGATSTLPIDASKGIEYTYFIDDQNRARPMLPLPRPGLVWIEGMITVKDPQGVERLLATYTRQQGLKPPDECGVALFNDAKQVFEPWFTYACRNHHVSSHPLLHEGYWYLYPLLRVPNDWNAIQDQTKWEKRDGQIPARASSVAWNEYRKRFILLSENFGEVFYSESERPEGPYTSPVRIVQHNDYNFYNVAHHPFLNQEGGRVIYFEGTYTDSFSKAKAKTPRYNYNQILYRLRLDDPRLKLDL